METAGYSAQQRRAINLVWTACGDYTFEPQFLALKADGKPDFSALLSYGNEAVMLEKLITETEKEMQAVRDAAKEKDLQKLDSLIHHLRSSWEVLRADQPLNVLYGLLRGDALPDGEALSHAVTAVLDKGVEIIRLAEEERRKYEDE